MWIGLEYFCEEGDSFWNMSEEDVTKFAISELTRMRVINGPDEVIDSHRERVRKAYPAYFDTYEHMDELIEYLDGFGNLYCVGRNGQHRYNNMDLPRHRGSFFGFRRAVLRWSSWRCTVNEVRRDSETQRTFMSGATAIITLNAWIGMGLFGMERATSGK